jgi:hypothetical protein
MINLIIGKIWFYIYGKCLNLFFYFFIIFLTFDHFDNHKDSDVYYHKVWIDLKDGIDYLMDNFVQSYSSWNVGLWHSNTDNTTLCHKKIGFSEVSLDINSGKANS